MLEKLGLDGHLPPTIPRQRKSCALIVVHVGQQHMAQVAFAEHHDMIEAFPADRADQPFCVCVLPGRTRRHRAVSNADRSNAADKYLSVCTIAIPDQVSRDLLPAASLRELIGDPFGCWICSNSEPQQLPPAMTHNQQAIEQPERDCRHHEQVHRGDPISMVAKERPPSLRGRNPPPHHIFGHAGLADIDAKLEKLAMDPRCSPQRIGDAYLAVKLAYLDRLGTASAAVLRFPSPIRSKSRTVLTDYGLRSDDCKCAIHLGKQSADATQYQPVNRHKSKSLSVCPGTS